jgi:hypothetical protein
VFTRMRDRILSTEPGSTASKVGVMPPETGSSGLRSAKKSNIVLCDYS